MPTGYVVCPRCGQRWALEPDAGTAFVAYCRRCRVRLCAPHAGPAVRYGGYTFADPAEVTAHADAA